MSSRWTTKQLKGFQDAAHSLKLHHRADLSNEVDGTSLIEELYVDPLPHDQILQTMMKPATTFVVGRKGTGKSTIFQRVQHELLKKTNYTSAYIDIKTLFDSSQVDPTLIAKTASIPEALSKESIEKLWLYRAFLRAVIREISDNLKKRVNDTMWGRIKKFFSGSIDELFEGLDILLKDIDSNPFSSIAGLRTSTIHAKNDSSLEADIEGTVNVDLLPTSGLKASLTTKDSEKASFEQEQTFADIL